MRPPGDHQPPHLRDLSEAECRALLTSHRIGRIAWNDAVEGPAVLPVNYTFDGKRIWVSTSVHSELARHFSPGRVAFEVDEYDEHTHDGWSVLARGFVRAAEPGELPPLEERPLPVVGGARAFHLWISVERLTGRRVLPR